MINFTGEDVEKYDKISKEVAEITKELEAKKQEIHTMASALAVWEAEINETIGRLDDLRTVTEKEVLRLESLTINDEPADSVEAPKEEQIEEPAPMNDMPSDEKPTDKEPAAATAERASKEKKAKAKDSQQSLPLEESADNGQ